MGGMLGIGGNVVHRGNDGSEDDVPVLGGILVEGDLNALEDIDLTGESFKGCFESQGGLATQLVTALELEHYYMLGHVS